MKIILVLQFDRLVGIESAYENMLHYEQQAVSENDFPFFLCFKHAMVLALHYNMQF
jgi:hypothetical protein